MVLYTMSTALALFEDCADLLPALASHPDHEVRWRVANFISKVRKRSDPMVRAIGFLKGDSCDTTQVYVRAWGLGASASQQELHPRTDTIWTSCPTWGWAPFQALWTALTHWGPEPCTLPNPTTRQALPPCTVKRPPNGR